jgi:hypothetical protein
MNRKYAIAFSIVALLFIVAVVVVAAYPKFKKIEKRGPPPETVAAIVPQDVNAAAAAIGNTFNKWSDFDRPDRIGTYLNKFPYGSHWTQNTTFPSDEEIHLDRGADAFVEQYVSIPPQLRVQDFYLYEPIGDYYWESEYFYNGRPAQFRSSFLIHVEPAGNSSTRVEIFEYQPTIWVGEYLGMSAHAILPTMLHDIRFVESTTADRKNLLALIQATATPIQAR